MAMGRLLRGGLPVFGALLVGGCGVTQEVHRSFPLAPDGRITLVNATGGARIEAWDYDEIRVDATTTAPDRARLERAVPRFDADPTSIRIWTEAREPEVRVPNRPLRSGPTTVRYELMVPRGATLERVDAGGSLSIRDVRGDIRAVTRDGSMRVELDRVSGERTIVLEADRGDITLVLPPPSDVRLNARAEGGVIASDIGIPLRNAQPGGGIVSELEEVRGNGSARIRLLARGGDIEIRTRPIP